MAANPKTAVATKNLGLNAKYDPLNSGYLRIYTGTQPTDPDTALSGNTLLVEFALASTAFGAASGGTKTLNSVSPVVATGTGTHTWWTLVKSDGTTRVYDNTAGVGNPLTLTNSPASIVAGATMTLSSLVLTEP